MNNHYQVAIIGAGPAGSSCAIQLARLGIKKVVLIEAGNLEKFRIGESIPPDSNRIFNQLGIYEDFIAQKHDPCFGSCSYWGSDKRGYNDFMLNPNGNGWHLDRTRFNHFLAHKATELGATLLLNTSFVKAFEEKEAYSITIKKKQQKTSTIHANIIVDASGSRSIFATTQGAYKLESEPLICLTMEYQKTDAKQTLSKLTHIETAELGWWYAAQLPNDKLLVAFYSNATVIKSLQLNKTASWKAYLDKTICIKNLTKHLTPIDYRPKGFPAPSFRLSKVSGHHWIAIGDAAAAYDPITSQGITKSILNGLDAAQLIAKRFELGHQDFQVFDQVVKKQFEQYQLMRQYFYQLEKRWEESPFWSTFHQPVVHF